MIKLRKPTHPGAVLREDVIKPLGLSVTEMAKRLNVSRKSLSMLINEKIALSPKMSIRIANATDTTPESWLFMQTKLDLWNVQQTDLEVEPLKLVEIN